MFQGDKSTTQSMAGSLKDPSVEDDQNEITIRSAISDDHEYYLQVYPDLEVDQSPADEILWNKRDMPNANIIIQGTQPVGYIWAIKYGDLYYLLYFIIEKEHRRRGIGTRALEYLKKHVNQLGFKRWGFDCNVNHQIPYNMCLKVGMCKIGCMDHIKAPYRSQPIMKTDLKVMVIHDPEQWPTIEEKYGLRKDCIKLWTASGSLVVLLVDSNGQSCGFTLFLPDAYEFSSLVVDEPKNFITLLNLLQGLKAEDVNPEWMHFWIDTGRQYSEIVLSSIPDAILCEKYDFLEGNTSD